MEGATNGRTAKQLGLKGCKHTREHAGDSQGSRLSAEAITETDNTARRTAICLQMSTLKYSQEVFRRRAYEETQNETKKEKKIADCEQVEDKTNRGDKNKTEKHGKLKSKMI